MSHFCHCQQLRLSAIASSVGEASGLHSCIDKQLAMTGVVLQPQLQLRERRVTTNYKRRGWGFKRVGFLGLFLTRGPIDPLPDLISCRV